jgi:hypothetical protein
MMMPNDEETTMTTEAPTPPPFTLFQLQTMAGQNYLTLLNEINALGIAGFLMMLDACTEAELHEMLASCDVVYQRVKRFKETQAVPKGG